MSIYDIEVTNAYGDVVSMSKYKGKVLLIINTATRCGFTKQYDTLQDLYEMYKADGFEILDFPCNQFANQAPESSQEIVTFCDATFGITFPIHEKIDVNGENTHPLYQYLKAQKGFQGFIEEDEHFAEKLSKLDPDYKNNADIKWNFTKFLVDREGNVVERYEPTDPIYDIEDRIRELL
jgi:glutathione peroxidase